MGEHEIERELQPKSFTDSVVSSASPLQIKRVAIAIPGIRTNADWVDQTAAYIEAFQDPLEIVLATAGRVSSLNLLTRLGLGKKRRQLLTQINTVIKDNPDAEISLICHSMGTDLIVDVLPMLNHKFEYILFIGSICHARHAQKLKQACTERFFNHRGTYDPWPLIASIARPFHYGPTGTFGFRNGSCVTDISFDNDHATCTELYHLTTFIIPTLKGQRPLGPKHVNDPLNFNHFHYFARTLYMLVALSCICPVLALSRIIPHLFCWFFVLLLVYSIGLLLFYLKGHSVARKKLPSQGNSNPAAPTSGR